MGHSVPPVLRATGTARLARWRSRRPAARYRTPRDRATNCTCAEALDRGRFHRPLEDLRRYRHGLGGVIRNHVQAKREIVNWRELLSEAREWWGTLSTEERYYAILIALSVGSVLTRLIPEATPSEQVMRVRIEDVK